MRIKVDAIVTVTASKFVFGCTFSVYFQMLEIPVHFKYPYLGTFEIHLSTIKKPVFRL